MSTQRLLLLSVIAFAAASCSPSKTESSYDTSNPYGTDTPASTTAQPAGDPAATTETASYQPVTPGSPTTNPTYSPAAYEDHGSGTTTKPPGTKSAKPTAGNPKAHTADAPSGPASTHVVVAGDSLYKISHKYHVSIAAIKAANHMTNDTVVLGKKLLIPAH